MRRRAGRHGSGPLSRAEGIPGGAGLDPTVRVPILGTCALVIGTLAFAHRPLRQTQRRYSASTLLELRERFYGPRRRRARRTLRARLLEPRRGEEPDHREVAQFFERLGYGRGCFAASPAARTAGASSRNSVSRNSRAAASTSSGGSVGEVNSP